MRHKAASFMVPDLAQELASQLAAIKGVSAVVLGGSYARGRQRVDSDIDIGLYYREQVPFAIADIRRIAAQVNDTADPVVTNFYRWGPWVNGGAWLTVRGQRVDFLYRSIDHIERVVEECQKGVFQSDFYQQPPCGFHSYVYLAETDVCAVLHDEEGIIAALKRRIWPYPEPLKRAIINRFAWACEFDLSHGRKSAALGDAYVTIGCLTRCAAHLVQVLYALNERYFLTDKGALQEAAGFQVAPEDFAARAIAALLPAGANPASLTRAVAGADALFGDVVALCGGMYQRPSFTA